MIIHDNENEQAQERAFSLKAELQQFTGTEHWYRHPLYKGFLYTDGIKYLAEQAGAYWLINDIALAQHFEIAVKQQEFQVWTLAVAPKKSAKLKCEDGNGNVIICASIRFTDFPLDSIKLFYRNNTLHLPSEY